MPLSTGFHCPAPTLRHNNLTSCMSQAPLPLSRFSHHIRHGKVQVRSLVGWVVEVEIENTVRASESVSVVVYICTFCLLGFLYSD